MTLIGIRGSHRFVNKALLLYALDQAPSLVIDCANCANPHALFPHISDGLDKVFVIEVELIYSFRDVLKEVSQIAVRLNAQCIVTTTFKCLFDYGDEHENKEIYEHSWELMKKISASYDVLVGICTPHEESASRYCNKIVELKKPEDFSTLINTSGIKA